MVVNNGRDGRCMVGIGMRVAAADLPAKSTSRFLLPISSRQIEVDFYCRFLPAKLTSRFLLPISSSSIFNSTEMPPAADSTDDDASPLTPPTTTASCSSIAILRLRWQLCFHFHALTLTLIIIVVFGVRFRDE